MPKRADEFVGLVVAVTAAAAVADTTAAGPTMEPLITVEGARPSTDLVECDDALVERLGWVGVDGLIV